MGRVGTADSTVRRNTEVVSAWHFRGERGRQGRATEELPQPGVEQVLHQWQVLGGVDAQLRARGETGTAMDWSPEVGRLI